MCQIKVKSEKIGKIVAGILLCVFLFSCINIPVYGASDFTDVFETDYFYEAVQEMSEKGYVKGYGDGRFGPRNNITIAESLTLLFRLAGIEVEPVVEGEIWYANVITLAKTMGVIKEGVDPNKSATRLEIAKFIIKIYQLDTAEVTVKDVFLDTNLAAANTMYQYGIFEGAPVSEGVVFMPYSYITRGDLSLVLYRLNDKISSPHRGTIQVGNYNVNINPTSFEDYMIIMKALGESGKLSISIPYTMDLGNVSYYLKIRSSAIEAFEQSFSKYPEYFSFTPSLSLKRIVNTSTSGIIVLTLSNAEIDDDTVLMMRESFDSKCDSIIDELKLFGVINENTSIEDKVRFIYEFVVLHCNFDLNYGVNSYTGYGAAVENLAVCQGYTAMFNKLCRLVNVDVVGVSGYIIETNEPHVWSKIYNSDIDSYFYCDVTFGDPVLYGSYFDSDNIDLTYFNMTYDEIMRDRKADF